MSTYIPKQEENQEQEQPQEPQVEQDEHEDVIIESDDVSEVGVTTDQTRDYDLSDLLEAAKINDVEKVKEIVSSGLGVNEFDGSVSAVWLVNALSVLFN
jgi:hypothetical protein